MSNTFDKLSVLDSFIREINSYLPEIEANLERLAQSPHDMEALEESYRRAHTIGGSASMMDFPGLAHVAHGMEDILGDVLDNLATLNPPTLRFLHRSLERIRRLVEGIHKGIDENAVIAEDDADYMQYRAQIELAAHATTDRDAQMQIETPAPSNPSSAIPSLDEMLAMFLTPGVPAVGEVAWPENPLPTSGTEVRMEQDTQPEPGLPAHTLAPPEPVPTSTLEMPTTPTSRVPEKPPVTYNLSLASATAQSPQKDDKLSEQAQPTDKNSPDQKSTDLNPPLNKSMKIFYCYAREDKDLRDELEKHLRTLKRQGKITSWHDRDISAGKNWEIEINTNLNTADIILLLISPDFMDSDYCYSIEMKRALERHHKHEARVIPIILRDCDWEDEPFSQLQVLPAEGKPVNSSRWHNRDEAFADIARGIRKVVTEMLEAR